MIGASFAALALVASLPSALAVTYEVQVAPGGEFIYDPPYVNAVAGDIVNFTFNPKAHTVTQSSFDQPCVALPGGTDSDFMPVAPDSTDPRPTFQVHVVDDHPVWFYCRQTGHCGAGMVFAINPGPDGSSNSFAEFQARAIALNGTAASSAPSATSTDTYVTPPPPHWETATATITHGESVWTTIYTSYDGTPPPSPAPEPANHVILVGDGGSLSYDPPSIQANVGDTVTFEFRAKNHTVTKSSFLQPCVRSVDAVTGELGFASGFQPVPAGTTSGFPQFSITINDTAPIWGYCGQTGHCGQGMVFAINAVEDGPNNFAAFQELARRINGTRSSDPSGGDASPSGDNNGGDSGSSQDGGDDGNAAASLWRPATGAVAALVGSVVALAL